ncbi:hypothetical protein [Micromonospora endolithica]|uniref:Uncharacterized protein n=1 Tax=Micromonospora endolithica TaxID=230091 RepID=A0A3A9ZRB0_9ACTN|nr:hypothetical protein [Micromonospora endolithica]RKN50770.1 hypothetical protein D7223_03180 [Micromonospora endolithica]TWJ20474.1 hypothetical protein JD76_00572 [Micromonospora endolithica]
MRAGDLLRQLDQRLLTRLAGAATRQRLGPARPRVLPAAAVLSCLAVLATAVWAGGERAVSDRTVGDVTRVGVAAGDSIPGYLRTAAADLAALPAVDPATGDGTYALVSFNAYLTAQRAAVVFGDVPVAAVFGRVPLPDRQTEIVRIAAQRLPDDVVTGMAALAARKDREAADYRSRAAALGGGDPAERELRQLYVSGAQVATAEAAAYRSGCACVYAAVIRAEPGTLRRLAYRPGVRAVDPAPEVRRLERTVFTPPLPEQEEVASPPADAGLADEEPTPGVEDRAPEPSEASVSASAAPTATAAPEVTDSSPDPHPPTPAETPPSTPPTSADVPPTGSPEATG